MAATQLSGSWVAAKKSFPSLERRYLSLPTYRVCSSVSLGCLRGLVSNGHKAATPKLSVSMCLNGHSTSTPGFEVNTTLKYTEDQPDQFTNENVKSYPTVEPVDGKPGMHTQAHSEVTPQQRKGAKIHDFCLGIPFGGFLFGGAFVGFLFSRNPTSLTTGMLSGGAILALSISSLKVWGKGKSSLPFILGQAVIAATLIWKHLQLYSLTKKIFPSGFYVFISASMLCFYSYVLISGGNPPPKKLATTTP